VPPVPPRTLAAVAGGGALGTLARYGLSRIVPGEPGGVPVATLLENVGGAFLLALVAGVLLARPAPDTVLRPFLLTGFLGSFTTFSTLAVETERIAAAPGAAVALAYPVLSVAAGLAAATAGLLLARLVPRRYGAP
jgi:fluoride exporter